VHLLVSELYMGHRNFMFWVNIVQSELLDPVHEGTVSRLGRLL